MSVIRTAVVALVLGVLAIVWWEYSYMLPKPKKEPPRPEITLSQTERECLVTLTYDDAESEAQIADMAFSVPGDSLDEFTAQSREAAGDHGVPGVPQRPRVLRAVPKPQRTPKCPPEMVHGHARRRQR